MDPDCHPEPIADDAPRASGADPELVTISKKN